MWCFRRKRSSRSPLPSFVLFSGGLLLFVSFSGIVLKFTAGLSEGKQQEQLEKKFYEDYRVSDQKHWVLIADSISSDSVSEATRRKNEQIMQKIENAVTEILLENMPDEFEQPYIKRIPIDLSPWASVDDQNFDKIMTTLNGDELMWGATTDVEERKVTAFFAISQDLGKQLGPTTHRRAPLKDFDFEQDPRHGLQFNPVGYNRLLGMVMLGMALETVQRAQRASGDEKKAEYLKAIVQLTEMRKKAINSRNDPIISRTLYSEPVDRLIADCQKKAGLVP